MAVGCFSAAGAHLVTSRARAVLGFAVIRVTPFSSGSSDCTGAHHGCLFCGSLDSQIARLLTKAHRIESSFLAPALGFSKGQPRAAWIAPL